MSEVTPNFAAVKQGLIPLTPQEKLKLEKDGLDVINDLQQFAKMGFASIPEDDFDRLKWYGVYRQKPKDAGYFMLRTKVPGGRITPQQAIVLSKIADEYAHGLCDITTRQTIQFHWLRIEDIPDIFEQLAAVGITTSGACGDDTRNITGCPVSGLNPDEVIDALPQLMEVSRNLTDNREFSNLPRKYKISISGCHLHCSQPDINCLGFFGLRNSANEAGYGVKVGGGLSSSPHFAQTLPVWIAPDQVWPVAKAISEIYRDEGYRAKRNRARFKFLVADWGVDKMLIEVEKRLGFTLARDTDISFPEDTELDHMGIHLQKSEGSSQEPLYWVGISFPGGRLRNGQLAAIGKIAERHAQPGAGQIRLTNKQNLILTHIPEAHLEALKMDLSAGGFIYEASNFRKGCVSCTGIEFCNLAVAETKNRMMALVGQLETTSGWYKDKVRIHFSGCPSSCGQHQIADIGLRGARTKIDGKMVDAYDLFVGGRLGKQRSFNELLKGKVIASEVHTAIDALLRYYDTNKQNSETFSDFCKRLPRAELLSALPEGIAKRS